MNDRIHNSDSALRFYVYVNAMSSNQKNVHPRDECAGSSLGLLPAESECTRAAFLGLISGDGNAKSS